MRGVLDTGDAAIAKIGSRVFDLCDLADVQPLHADCTLIRDKINREWKLVHKKLAKEKLLAKDKMMMRLSEHTKYVAALKRKMQVLDASKKSLRLFKNAKTVERVDALVEEVEAFVRFL